MMSSKGAKGSQWSFTLPAYKATDIPRLSTPPSEAILYVTFAPIKDDTGRRYLQESHSHMTNDHSSRMCVLWRSQQQEQCNKPSSQNSNEQRGLQIWRSHNKQWCRSPQRHSGIQIISRLKHVPKANAGILASIGMSESSSLHSQLHTRKASRVQRHMETIKKMSTYHRK